MNDNLNPAKQNSCASKVNLVIDFGNTLTKVAVFQNNVMLKLEKTTQLSTRLLENIREEFLPAYAIISTVVEVQPEIKDYLEKHFEFYELTHMSKLPITNLYQTPETLGKDRLAAVIGTSALFPGNDCLVIDAGTCITFDFINKEARYFGGAISPGISLRFKALHNFTSRLPLVSQRKFEGLTGATTEESILSGVLNGTVAELNGIISNFCDNYPGISVIITGGDMNYFDKKLKSNIFAVPNLVLIGLNVTLDFNVKEK